MYGVSSAFLNALRSPSMVIKTEITASDGSVLSAIDGSVSMDSRRNITRTASLELTATATRSASEIYDLVMTPGTEITIKRGLQVPTKTQTGTRTNLATNPSMEALTGGFNTVRTNLVTNPNFETNTTGWTGTISRSTTEAYIGSASGQMPFTAASDNGPYTIATATPSAANTLSAYVKAEAGKLFRMRVLEYNGATYVAESSTGTITGTGSWQRVSVTRTFGATGNAARIHFENRTNGAHTFYVDAVLLETSSTVGDYFDGATAAAGDFSYAWTGTANASTSIERGAQVTSISGNAATGISSTDWFGAGTRSLRVIPTFQTVTDSFLAVGGDFGAMRLGMVAGKTYTVSATARLTAALTGTLDARARRILFYYVDAGGVTQAIWSSAVPNAAGTTRLSMTFTIPVGATGAWIRLYHGGLRGSGSMWWDAFMLEETATLGEYFDGSSGDASWTGSANASTSTQAVYTIGTAIEYVPLGVFSTDTATIDRGTSGTVQWNGSDRSKKISRARFTDPYQITAGTALATAGSDLLQSRWAQVETNFVNVADTVTAQLIYESGESSDPWEQARKLFADYSYDLNFDGDGVARVVLLPDPANATTVFDFGTGETNLVLGAENTGSTEKVYNGVICSGEGSDIATPIRAEAWDDNPTSPTYYLGNFGKAPLFYSSPLLTTAVIAQAAARSLLAKLKGRVDGLTWPAVVNPALEPLDVITMNINGNQVTAVIDSLTIPLKASESMTAVARQTT
jgi:hypothetical protein